MVAPTDPWVWVDGTFVRASSACLRFDRWDPWTSFSLAESVPVSAGKPLWLRDHLERLAEAAHAIGWAAVPMPVLARVARALIRRNALSKGGLRLRWWGGLDQPLLLVLPLKASSLRGPLRLMTSAVRHYGPDSLNARAKAGQMLSNRLVRAETEAFAEDGLRLCEGGLVAEGVFSNVALLRRGVVQTPPPVLGLLDGITRRHFLVASRRAGFAVREEPMTRYDLWTAERVWVLSSLRGVLQVSSVDGRPTGSKKIFSARGFSADDL